MIGYIGLAEFIPFFAFSFFTGHFADNFSRTKIARITILLLVLQASLLVFLSANNSSFLQTNGILPLYLTVVLWGIIRAFMSPALQALMPEIVPRNLYANAATWNSTVWHIAAITGPTIGGILCAYYDFNIVYSVVVSSIVIGFILFCFITTRPAPENKKEESIMKSFSTGLKFVFGKNLLLSALSLDLFAVLFGGATAMLPAYADKILHVGATELGVLRAAPAIGAVIVAIILAYFPPMKGAGKKLLFSVAAFGVCTIFFGISENYFLSFFLLALLGAFDNISVVIRHTILQLMTPDNMRGRVGAVNGIFIGSSNELGAFESGLAAGLMGLVPSVIFGGGMTLVIVIVIAILSRQLRQLNMNNIR